MTREIDRFSLVRSIFDGGTFIVYESSVEAWSYGYYEVAAGTRSAMGAAHSLLDYYTPYAEQKWVIR